MDEREWSKNADKILIFMRGSQLFHNFLSHKYKSDESIIN